MEASLKIAIGMDYETIGAVEILDGELVYSGNEKAVRPIVEFYAARHEGALHQLLESLPHKLNGRTWARMITDQGLNSGS